MRSLELHAARRVALARRCARALHDHLSITEALADAGKPETDWDPHVSDREYRGVD